MIDLHAMLRESPLEVQFYTQIQQDGLPLPEWQYMIEDHRADFAWPDLRICVEIQGGTWKRGAHNRAQGYADDRILNDRRQLAGWIVLEFTRDHLDSGEAHRLAKEAIWRRTQEQR